MYHQQERALEAILDTHFFMIYWCLKSVLFSVISDGSLVSFSVIWRQENRPPVTPFLQ